MADFSQKKGGVQKNDALAADPRQSGVPATGFQEAPMDTNDDKWGPGPAVGNSRRGIH